MKNDTTFVRMRSGAHLGNAKMRETETVFTEWKKKGRSTKRSLRFFLIFALGLSYDLSKFHDDDFTPFFNFERP